jgi:hypothetical protein
MSLEDELNEQERLDEERQEKRDYSDAGKLAREDPLKRAARAFLAAVATTGLKQKPSVSPHAIGLGALLLVERAIMEARGAQLD